MRWAVAVTALAVALGGNSPSRACSWIPGWPDKVRMDLAEVARTHVASAASVDIVKVETVDQNFDFAVQAMQGDLTAASPGDREAVIAKYQELRDEWATGARRFHFRVIERLKGNGPLTFALSGLDAAEAYGPATAPDEPADIAALLDVVDFADWSYDRRCSTPLLVWRDGTYLVFRDHRGQLLHSEVPYTFEGNRYEWSGPSFVSLGKDDPWLAAVQKAAMDEQGAEK